MPDKRGRPSLDPDGDVAGVYLRLRARDYDALYTQARRMGVSVPEFIRRSLRPTTRATEHPDEQSHGTPR